MPNLGQFQHAKVCHEADKAITGERIRAVSKQAYH